MKVRESKPLPVNLAWLASDIEEPIDPGLPIVDAHHHLWNRPDLPYLVEDMKQDIEGGHRIEATVFAQCRTMYRTSGPEALRPVGETEFAAGVARATGGRICTGIICHADLLLGDAVATVLEEHLKVGDGRVCGVRHSTVWSPDPEVLNKELGTREGMLDDPQFDAGMRQLTALGLTYDALVYHPQLDDLTRFAKRHPRTRIVLNHVGGPIGIGFYAGRREEVFATWRKAMTELAKCDNVLVKLGGMAMRLSGLDFHKRPIAPSSEDLSVAFRPWVETCIELFGTRRCMFQSNFPVDKASCSYTTLWNAFKRLTAAASQDERKALFFENAVSCYELRLPSQDRDGN